MKIKILSTEQHKLEVVKLIKLFSGLSLFDSKHILDQSSAVFLVENPELNFDQISKNFEAIGAKVEEFNEDKSFKLRHSEEKSDLNLSSKPHEASDT